MTEHREIATGKDGGKPAAKGVDRGDADCVDTTVELVEAILNEPVPNSLARYACRQQLPSRTTRCCRAASAAMRASAPGV
ncbi:MAG TPA: hypothetical protein VES62_06420, partial [Thermoleophilaceae bacterium]|nr:hypothetical protein [Thermoleophilaceae bacterium]